MVAASDLSRCGAFPPRAEQFTGEPRAYHLASPTLGTGFSARRSVRRGEGVEHMNQITSLGIGIPFLVVWLGLMVQFFFGL